MRLAVIPARGGSKRIPRKNIKPFSGQPIIAWSIQAAIESQCFDRIIVSTDDQEIADIATKYGAEVPFFRPKELSGDYTGTVPVIAHAVDWQNTVGQPVVSACCIYATAPFVQPSDLVSGLRILEESDAEYAFTVASFESPIQRAIRINDDFRVEMFRPEYYEERSQDLEAAWHDAGQFYWGKADAWLKEKKFYTSSAIPIIVPRSRVQDIDTPEDWRYAEMLFQFVNKHVNIR